MAVGIFGSKKLADCTASDTDILYCFSENRETLGSLQFTPLYNNVTNSDFIKLFGVDGAYKIRLPASTFSSLGFYLILIKPKSYQTTIIDCSFIISTQDQSFQISKKGIVIPKLQFQSSGSLIGYQLEYFDQNLQKIRNFHRIITSSDLVSPAPQSNQSLQPTSQSYVLDNNGSMLFLTLSPSDDSLINSTAVADLGRAGQSILISNTFFDPVMVEVEILDQNIKTLSYALYGNSSRDLETGIFSIFSEDNFLYKQYNLLTRKKQFSSGEVDTREERSVINFNQSFLSVSQQTP